MKIRCIAAVFFVLITFYWSHANETDSIPFMENAYEEALLNAEKDYKPLLFYFHSSGCYDCLEVDSLLQLQRIVQYFKLNYVNVRVDFDEPMGIRLSKQFKVHSLPALVYLNENHELIFVLDSDIRTEKILNYARWTINPQSRSYTYNDALEKKRKILNWERVDSVFDFTVIDNMVIEKVDSTTMYFQSWLHKTLDDGLASEHAEKYMSTQEDWSTEKNTDFILAFVSDTRSPMFTFLIENEQLFIDRYGQEKIENLIGNLIHNRLYRLQPPPQYSEAKDLLGIISPKNTDVRTYEYLIELKYRTNHIIEYLHLERKYLQKFAPKDHKRMMRLVKTYLERISDDYNVDFYLEMAKTANKLNPNDLDYMTTLAKVYIKKGDKCGALSAAVRAYVMALETGAEATELLRMIVEIDSMYRSL